MVTSEVSQSPLECTDRAQTVHRRVWRFLIDGKGSYSSLRIALAYIVCKSYVQSYNSQGA